MTRLEELQKIINAYYQKGGDYGGAAKAFGDIDGWNNLVRERDRLRDSGSKKPVHKTIDTSPGIGPGTPRAHYTMNPIVVRPKKESVPQTISKKAVKLVEKYVSPYQSPGSTRHQNRTIHIADLGRVIDTKKIVSSQQDSPKIAPTPKYRTKVGDIINDVSDMLTGWAYRGKEASMSKKVEEASKWGDTRFNKFMLGENSPIKKNYREHIGKLLPIGNKTVYIDKGTGALGDELAMIWNEATQKVEKYHPVGMSRPAMLSGSKKSYKDILDTWERELRVPPYGIEGTYGMTNAKYSWLNPMPGDPQSRKDLSSKNIKKFDAAGGKNYRRAFQFLPSNTKDSLQTTWGVHASEASILPNALHSQLYSASTPGCTSFAPKDWDMLYALLAKNKSPWVAQYDEMLSRGK